MIRRIWQPDVSAEPEALYRPAARLRPQLVHAAGDCRTSSGSLPAAFPAPQVSPWSARLSGLRERLPTAASRCCAGCHLTTRRSRSTPPSPPRDPRTRWQQPGARAATTWLPGRADPGRRRRQPQHDRRAEQRRRGADAMGRQRQCDPRDVVPGQMGGLASANVLVGTADPAASCRSGSPRTRPTSPPMTPTASTRRPPGTARSNPESWARARSCPARRPASAR